MHKKCLPWILSPAILVLLGICLLFYGCSSEAEEKKASRQQQEMTVDVCALVSKEDLRQIYRKELFATAEDNGCFWSLEKGAMAYLHISIQDKTKDVRDHFNSEIPSHIALEEISDLGDGGLLTIAEGTLGVIVISKGNKIIKSAATFLDIKPGSKEHKALWSVYQKILRAI